jgi:hypothetical protein
MRSRLATDGNIQLEVKLKGLVRLLEPFAKPTILKEEQETLDAQISRHHWHAHVQRTVLCGADRTINCSAHNTRV